MRAVAMNGKLRELRSRLPLFDVYVRILFGVKCECEIFLLRCLLSSTCAAYKEYVWQCTWPFRNYDA